MEPLVLGRVLSSEQMLVDAENEDIDEAMEEIVQATRSSAFSVCPACTCID
jgi:hypothetical protein